LDFRGDGHLFQCPSCIHELHTAKKNSPRSPRQSVMPCLSGSAMPAFFSATSQPPGYQPPVPGCTTGRRTTGLHMSSRAGFALVRSCGAFLFLWGQSRKTQAAGTGASAASSRTVQYPVQSTVIRCEANYFAFRPVLHENHVQCQDRKFLRLNYRWYEVV
jgi:hypothetical protein